jgi:hypothetical protein
MGFCCLFWLGFVDASPVCGIFWVGFNWCLLVHELSSGIVYLGKGKQNRLKCVVFLSSWSYV